MTEAFPWTSATTYLVPDNERGYGRAFRSRVRAMGTGDRPDGRNCREKNSEFQVVERKPSRSALINMAVY
jgi:hypothetical protein